MNECSHCSEDLIYITFKTALNPSISQAQIKYLFLHRIGLHIFWPASHILITLQSLTVMETFHTKTTSKEAVQFPKIRFLIWRPCTPLTATLITVP